MKDETYIVIAAYDEEKSILNVLKDLRSNGFENIIVVDDGSKDNTYQKAHEAGVYALRHVINRGQGAALKTGIDFALLKGAKYIVTFDADGQHQAKEIDLLLKPLREGIADITLGSRFIKKTNIPLKRKVLLKGSVFVIWLFYGLKMTDAHNGFRALSRKAAQEIRILSDRMEHGSEIIEEIRRNRLRYIELPVTIKYTKYSLQKGQGSFSEAVRVLCKMLVKKIMN